MEPATVTIQANQGITSSTINVLNGRGIRFSTTSIPSNQYTELRAPLTPGTSISFRLPSAYPISDGQMLGSTPAGVTTWKYGFPSAMIKCNEGRDNHEYTTTSQGPGSGAWSVAAVAGVINVTGGSYVVTFVGVLMTDDAKHSAYATILCDGVDISSGNGFAQCYSDLGGVLACPVSMTATLSVGCSVIQVGFGNDDGATQVRWNPLNPSFQMETHYELFQLAP